jgi:hypothetical protein
MIKRNDPGTVVLALSELPIGGFEFAAWDASFKNPCQERRWRKIAAMSLSIRACVLGFLLLSLAAFAQQDSSQDAPPTGNLSVTVVRETNGKPVNNAEIVLHLLDKSGKEKQEGLELKTHKDGKAETSGIPYGMVRIQVIARGFRTYGQDYAINQPSLEITIKMQKPRQQFSIYK